MTRIFIVTESILALASILLSDSLVTWRTNGLITDIRWRMSNCKQQYKQLKAISFPFPGKNGGKLVEIPSGLRSLDNTGVVLKERDSTRYIEVFLDALVEIGSRQYVVGHPCDWAVTLGEPDGKEGLRPISLESDEMDDVFTPLEKSLGEDGITLMRTAGTLTLQGEFLDEGEEEDDEEEEESDEEELDDEMEVKEYDWSDDFEIINQGSESTSSYIQEEVDTVVEEEDFEPSEVNAEGVKLIASFFYNNKKYSLVKHLEPMLFVARRFDSENVNYLVNGHEATEVIPIVEELLLAKAQADAKEERSQ